MRILHLGFEDHRRPGSGGGSHRSHEINRRLVSQGHRVDVVTAAFRGARERNEDGVRYRHIGDGRGYFRSILTYQACLAPLVARLRVVRDLPDLLVEEFAPPFSTLGLGAGAGVASVGNVQGYFAAEKARQYRVPVRTLTGIERWGTRRHGHLIALSADLADQLQAAAPAAHISVVGMGLALDEIARALEEPVATVPGRLVFLGRLDVDQKGLDLLIEAFASVRLPDARLLIAGDGRDQSLVEEIVRRFGVNDRVQLLGRVSGADKWRLLASAQVSVVSSRYETFGLSALEALACGTPVAGFSIACLNETVPTQTGRLVPAFDVEALTSALEQMLADQPLCDRLGEAGIARAQGLTWESIAALQLRAYETAVADHAKTSTGLKGTPF